MRKVVLFMSVSADGFFEGPDRELDWHRVDEELHQHFNETLAGMSAFLDGRVTYELMADFWPTVGSDPSNPATMVEFSRIWREMPKVVFSRTLAAADWNTTILREVSVEEVRALCAQPGGDMALGGADLAASFLALDLVDELRLYVHPVLIGRGRRLFPDSDLVLDLDLVESRTFGNGVVLLRYARAATA